MASHMAGDVATSHVIPVVKIPQVVNHNMYNAIYMCR